MKVTLATLLVRLRMMLARWMSAIVQMRVEERERRASVITLTSRLRRRTLPWNKELS